MSYTIDEQNLERQRLLATVLEPATKQLLDTLRLPPGSRLDLGCGIGETTRLRAPARWLVRPEQVFPHRRANSSSLHSTARWCGSFNGPRRALDLVWILGVYSWRQSGSAGPRWDDTSGPAN